MRGIILAGGTGSRLHPITLGVSKQLVPVHDKPMIYYPLSTLMLAGIRDIMIITTEDDAPQFQRLLGDGSQFGVDLTYQIQHEPNGLAQPSYWSRPHRQSRLLLEEKPANPRSNYSVPGLYFLRQRRCRHRHDLEPSARGEYEITDVNRAYSKLVASRSKYFLAAPRGSTPELSIRFDASNYVRTIEERQGLKIGAPEEVAWRHGFITDDELRIRAEKLLKSGYGKYLLELSTAARTGDMADTHVMSQYRELKVPGAWEFTPKQFGDDRGVFSSGSQANCSVSAAGVLRGIHFADVPPGQAKYVTCAKGAILDIAVDLRVGSPTFGQWDSVLLDDVNRRAIFLSEGPGHAFLSSRTTRQWFTRARRDTPPEPVSPLNITLSANDTAAPSLQDAGVGRAVAHVRRRLMASPDLDCNTPAGMTGRPGPLMRVVKNQALAFLLVGGVNTALGTAWFIAWQIALGDEFGYHFAIVAGYVCNLLCAFAMYRYLVFEVRGHFLRDFWRFVVVNFEPS
ncbi:unnamed protein product, partial [Mesorhabditis spiculigera]